MEIKYNFLFFFFAFYEKKKEKGVARGKGGVWGGRVWLLVILLHGFHDKWVLVLPTKRRVNLISNFICHLLWDLHLGWISISFRPLFSYTIFSFSFFSSSITAEFVATNLSPPPPFLSSFLPSLYKLRKKVDFLKWTPPIYYTGQDSSYIFFLLLFKII